MFNDTAEVIKTAAVFLAIVLPIIATAFAYRAASRDKAKPTIGPEGFAAIGGALVTQDMLAKAMDTAHEVKESINRLARAIEVYNDKAETIADHLKDMCEEIVKVRRVVEDINPRRGRRT